MQKNTETEMLIITNTDTIIIVGIFFIDTKIEKIFRNLIMKHRNIISFLTIRTLFAQISFMLFQLYDYYLARTSKSEWDETSHTAAHVDGTSALGVEPSPLVILQ